MSEEGVNRGAILLMSIGEEEAVEVFKYLGPKEVQKLGLAMAKRFVDEHRGLIDFATSRKGTTFRIVLPPPDPSLPGMPSIPPP